ncbi:unnamed protein product [Haemonchus placei]|uniref:Secreted protein n=1 Tax=Haemonchus placei TaxID=6290 RepID=A0A0N4X2L9_HAEPC|nr:unnamed protein product [Haemonchus placei]
MAYLMALLWQAILTEAAQNRYTTTPLPSSTIASTADNHDANDDADDNGDADGGDEDDDDDDFLENRHGIGLWLSGRYNLRL